jgi:hypothetical protein
VTRLALDKPNEAAYVPVLFRRTIMPSSRSWLYQRLSCEEPTGGGIERWNTIVSRLRPLIPVDDSANDPGYGSRCATAREERTMTPGECRLASLAVALIGEAEGLTDAEREIVSNLPPADPDAVRALRAQIRGGCDVLGDMFCSLRRPEQRRLSGAIYTPPPIVEAMVQWAKSQPEWPERIVDPGVGSGRFLMSAAEAFPRARLIGVDIDPMATLMLRANAAVRGFAHRLSVQLGDYRQLELPAIGRATLFIGNPPYVRHHDIGERWKTWFAATAARYQLKASKLAGLHIHFFLKTRELAQKGDFGTFITAAEWLDVNYGRLLRNMLADGLGGAAIHLISPTAQPFADALTTGAITCFRVGERSRAITIRTVNALAELAPLTAGRSIAWGDIASAGKWSTFTRESHPRPAGFVELGEIFRVHRGQVTGSNSIWIDNDATRDVPNRHKPLTVTGARELLLAGHALASTRGLRRVVDLPVDLTELDDDERKAVRQFLAWAKQQGADQTYTARSRKAWWSVGLRAPAPILCTYMARRAPAFVRNLVRARHLNIAHGLYPRQSIEERDLLAIVAYLRRHVGTTGGRTYAGGLVKYEPKELERILMPTTEDIHAYLAEAMELGRNAEECDRIAPPVPLPTPSRTAGSL